MVSLKLVVLRTPQIDKLKGFFAVPHVEAVCAKLGVDAKVIRDPDGRAVELYPL